MKKAISRIDRSMEQKQRRPRNPRKNCNPTICCQDTLSSGGTFVDWEEFKLNCLPECKMKSTCAYIITLLDKGKHEEALETLKNAKL